MASDAARMDAIYRSQRHIYDLTRRYYLLGRDALIERLAIPAHGSALEIGCGTGRNLVQAARRYPGARLCGLDISAAMLETAKGSIAKAGLDARIALARGDATAFDPAALFGERTFDRVFLSYTVSMIPRWRAAIEQAARAVAPGGSLHLVDFGQQERLPQLFRAALFAWLARFEVSPRAELFDALERIAGKQGMRLACESRYGGYAWTATLSRPS